jgi:hypothetical protein
MDERQVWKGIGFSGEFQHAKGQIKADHTAVLLLPEAEAEQARPTAYVQDG